MYLLTHISSLIFKFSSDAGRVWNFDTVLTSVCPLNLCAKQRANIQKKSWKATWTIILLALMNWCFFMYFMWAFSWILFFFFPLERVLQNVVPTWYSHCAHCDYIFRQLVTYLLVSWCYVHIWIMCKKSQQVRCDLRAQADANVRGEQSTSVSVTMIYVCVLCLEI